MKTSLVISFIIFVIFRDCLVQCKILQNTDKTLHESVENYGVLEQNQAVNKKDDKLPEKKRLENVNFSKIFHTNREAKSLFMKPYHIPTLQPRIHAFSFNEYNNALVSSRIKKIPLTLFIARLFGIRSK